MNRRNRAPRQEIDASGFETIFAQSPAPAQIFDKDGASLIANRAWEKLWGIKHSVLAGWYNVRKDDELKKHKVNHLIERAFKGEVVEFPAIKYETQTELKKSGVRTNMGFRWVSALAFPIKDAQGRVKNVVVQHQDITKQKQAEDDLIQSETRLKAIWDSTPDAVALSDETGTVLAANAAYHRLYGYSIKEVIGKNFAIIFPKSQRENANALYHDTFYGSKETAKGIHEVVSKDGKKHIVESQYSFILEHGKRKAMLSVVRDITDQHNSDALLKKEQERLKLALEAGAIGVWDWDVASNKLTWTEKVYELHGVTPGTKIDFKLFMSLVHPADRSELQQAIDTAFKDKAPYNVQLRIVTPSGETRWLTTSAIMKFDAAGKPQRMLGATSDITRLKEIEQERNDFVGIATHELKTPVTSLKVYTETLEQKFMRAGDDQSAGYLSRMNIQIDKLTRLIEDMLDVTKIEAGKLQMKQEDFDLDELVAETVEDVQHTTERHTIAVSGKSNAKIHADRERTGQVLINLLTNAIKYSPHSKNILVTLARTNGSAQISVTDYGVGIPKSKQMHIFDRFYRVRGADTDTYPGLGLGLYISKEIIERQGGKIWCKSKTGSGSTFSFSLPIAKKQTSPKRNLARASSTRL